MAPERGAIALAAPAMALFCAATVVFLVARDLFVPHVRDVEVWAGFEVRGALARATAPIHWALFAAAAWAFWRERPWIWSAAACYALYVAASHVVWNLASPSGGGVASALWQGAVFALPAVGLGWVGWTARAGEREARSKRGGV